MKKSEYKKMYELEDSHFWFIAKRFFIKTYLDTVKNDLKKILDIGCGTGGTTKFLKRYGEVIGLEKNSYAATLSRKRGLKVVRGEGERLPFKSKFFDLVTLFDVLYHKEIASVDRAIKEAKRVLRPKGYIMITDSAFNSLKGSHGESVYEKRRFTLPQMINRLKKNHLKVVKFSYIYFSIILPVLIKRKLLDKLFVWKESEVSPVHPVINGILIAVLKLESLFLKFVRLPVGSSLIILAKK